MTQLSNGITVTSKETGSPYTNIAVYIKCGSRVENYNEQGLTHLLRNCAFLVGSLFVVVLLIFGI